MLISVTKIMKQNDKITVMCQDMAAEWNAREGNKVFSEIPEATGPRSPQARTLILGSGCNRSDLGWEGETMHEWLSLL